MTLHHEINVIFQFGLKGERKLFAYYKWGVGDMVRNVAVPCFEVAHFVKVGDCIGFFDKNFCADFVRSISALVCCDFDSVMGSFDICHCGFFNIGR